MFPLCNRMLGGMQQIPEISRHLIRLFAEYFAPPQLFSHALAFYLNCNPDPVAPAFCMPSDHVPVSVSLVLLILIPEPAPYELETCF